MSRRRGTVYPHRGRWRVQLTETDGRRHSLGVYDTEGEAWRVLHAYLQQSETPEDSLLAYGARWLDRRELDGVRGIRQERSVWRQHVVTAPFAGVPLKRIQRKQVAAWVRDRLEAEAVDTITLGRGDKRETKRRPTGRTVSRQTVVHARRLLSACLEAAADDGLISANPAADVRVPRGEPSAPRWTFLSPDELRAIERCKGRDVHRLGAVVAIYTGLRQSEQRLLRWEHVHLDGPRPHLRVTRAKSQSSIREVPLLPPAVAALRTLRDRGEVRRVTGYVWGQDGSPHARGYDWQWETTRERASITRPVRWHDLRHTCASHLVQGTWGRPLTLYETMAWMGHSSIGVTQRYAHLSPEGLHGIAEDLRRGWRKAGGRGGDDDEGTE